MINLNASLWDRIALLADIPESFPLYKYIKIENKMFAEARSLKESLVKSIKDLKNFTVLRVTLGEVYKYLSDNDCTTGLDLITVKEEDIKAKGLFTSIKDFYKKSKNSKSEEVDNIEKFIYLFVSKRTQKDKSEDTLQEVDAKYLNLREKIKKIQNDIAERYRNNSNGSSLFELVKNTDLFGLNLNKYLGTNEEIYVYKFLYLLFSLFWLDHNKTNFYNLLKELETMNPRLSLTNFKLNLHDYQDILFSNQEALEYLICNLGGDYEDVSRTLCFYYAMEQYSIKTDITDSRKKRKGGILLFNILRNPGLEVMPAYVINKKEIENTNKLPAFYTKYGYYLDNIINECSEYETIHAENSQNTYQNKARILNCALQFLIKKAFLSLTAQPNSSEEVLAGKINEVNMELEELRQM